MKRKKVTTLDEAIQLSGELKDTLAQLRSFAERKRADGYDDLRVEVLIQLDRLTERLWKEPVLNHSTRRGADQWAKINYERVKPLLAEIAQFRRQLVELTRSCRRPEG
jgi:hypothetical protein